MGELTGYSAGEICFALHEIMEQAPSEGKILEYIKRNNLYKRRGYAFLVPEANLGKLVEGMNLPVRVRDLVGKL